VTCRFVSLFAMAALLACPYVCQSGMAGAADGSGAPRACCPRCHPPADSETTPVPTDEECTASCLCKGAVLGDGLPDLRPDASLLLAFSPAVELATAQAESPFLLARSPLPDLYGESLRIAIASWLC